MNGNKKLFWKEVSKANGGKVKSLSKISDRNERLGLKEVYVRRIWEEYFQYLYNIDTQEKVVVHTCDFDGARRGNCFG